MRTLTEYISDMLSNTKLFEMALEKSKYINKVQDLIQQILENWCLIVYVHTYDIDSMVVNHWKLELKCHLLQLQVQKLKGGNKLRATREALIKEYEYDRNDLTGLLENKFTKEKLWNESKVKQIAKRFNKEIPMLCEIIASHTQKEVRDYVDSL